MFALQYTFYIVFQQIMHNDYCTSPQAVVKEVCGTFRLAHYRAAYYARLFLAIVKQSVRPSVRQTREL